MMSSSNRSSVKEWVKFFSSTQQSSLVEPCTDNIHLTLQEEGDNAEDVRQLVDLLLQASSTHCAILERIKHFTLFYYGASIHSEIVEDSIDDLYVDWAYRASDAIPHHLDAMTRQLCRFLGNLPPAITSVEVSASRIHPTLGTLMLESLSKNRRLTELNMVCFQVATYSLERSATPDWVPRWVSETIGNNNEGCSCLMRACFNEETSKLRRFTFSNADVTELDAGAFELLKCNTHLQHLHLEKNHFGDAGAFLIAAALKVNKTLKDLEIFDCGIDVRGCMALGQALYVNNTLEELRLNGNKFGDVGASLIAEVLKVNKTLKYVKMKCCDIGDLGCAALAHVLEVNNKTLKKLNLDGNRFADPGVRAFLSALRVNRSLRSLGLYNSEGPGISQETEEELVEVVCHFLLPLGVGLRVQRETGNILRRAYFFNQYFDDECQALRDGTTSCSDTSIRWFLPLLGSTHPLVKPTVLFLLLRQRAEVASQSLCYCSKTKD